MNKTIDILNDIGERLYISVKDELRKYSSLKDSNILNDPDSISWEIDDFGDDEYELVMQLPNYAINIDRGRGKNKKMPPSKDGQGRYPIRDWMKRKGIPKDKEYIIRKTIAVRGIKARPFLDATITNVLMDINDILLTGSMKIANEKLEEILKKIR